MPGPLAAQLAMWLGYLERGARGALWVALPFVVPPFLLVTAVAALYAHYQGLSQVQSVFFGVGPAVMAIIAIAAYKLARSTNKRDPVLWLVAAIVCVATVISGAEIVWLFIGAGLFGALYYGGGLPRLAPGSTWRRAAPAGECQGLRLAWFRRFPRHDGRLLRQGERLHVRLRAGGRALPPPGPRHGPPLADRASVHGCGRDGADQPRAGRDHGHLRR